MISIAKSRDSDRDETRRDDEYESREEFEQSTPRSARSLIIMPKSKQESEETSPAHVISSKTEHHEHLMTSSDRVQEEQVDIELTVDVDPGEEGTSTKKQYNQIVDDTTRSEQLVDDTVQSGDNGQNEAPNLPIASCEKEAEYALDNDNESICTVYISELDDLLLPKDRR